MPVRIHILSASKGIRPFEARLRSITKSVAAATKKSVPLDDVDVVFYVNPEGAIKEIGGIGGYTPAADIVFISLDPRNRKFKLSIKSELPFTLAHEFHHAIRFRTPIKKETLLEAMITEGLADHFALAVTGRKDPPVWCGSLTVVQKKKYLKRAAAGWHESPYDHHGWFFGSRTKRIPRWTGYALGFELVEKYLRAHPRVRTAALVAAHASLFAK